MMYQPAHNHAPAETTSNLRFHTRLKRTEPGVPANGGIIPGHARQPAAAGVANSKNNNVTLMETRQLPRSIQSFIRLIGIRATWRILKQFGGRTVYIPKRLRRDCILLKALDDGELCALAQYYGGETVDLPKVDTIERHQRNLAIAAASAAGASRAELVAHYGLSRRQIGNIRRQYRTLIDRLSSEEAV